MSETPRSVLKKSSIPPENRKVHFADPVSFASEKQSRKKQLSHSSGSAAKKPKIADVTSFTISNQQSEIMETIREVESKFAKQSRMTMELTNDLLAFTDSRTAISSETKRIAELIADSSQQMKEAQRQSDELIEAANRTYEQYEMRAALSNKFSQLLAEFQKSIAVVNCSRSGSKIDFDHLIALLDNLDQLSAEF